MSRLLRPSLSLLLIVLSVLGLLNVYSDNSDVVRMAGKLACDSCEPRLVQSGRSPITQTMTFQTGPTALVTVECQRQLIFIGDYTCQAAKH